MPSPSPAQKTHHHPRFECSVHSHGLIVVVVEPRRNVVTGRPRVSVNGSSVALHCELRAAPLVIQTAGSTASVRTVVLTTAQAVREDKSAEPDDT